MSYLERRGGGGRIQLNTEILQENILCQHSLSGSDDDIAFGIFIITNGGAAVNFSQLVHHLTLRQRDEGKIRLFR